ncbi:MAG: recN [Acidobacteria bacterium]|nr:recN [Acidobacteriota bacterium]
MLRFLSIERLAVIDALEVEFAPGLNVVTGETGAGKSIVVEAVELLLGGRASADLVRTGEDHARIQAVLETPDGREVIVRREVSASGRSRAFVDGALVASGALRDVTGPLIDLHGQHEHQELLATTAHLALLDRYAGLEALRLQVSSAFDDMQRARTNLESSQLDDRERTARLDLLRFQLGEIERIGPKLGEDELLEAERQVLANADRVMRLASEAYDALYEGDAAALARLAVVWRKLDELASLDPRFAPFLAQRDPVQLPLTDLAHYLRGYAGDLDASPERLQQVEERLAALQRLKKRYGPRLEDVLSRRNSVVADIDALSASAERVAELEARLATARAAYLDVARELSAQRRREAAGFTRALTRNLAELAMEHAVCEFRFAGSGEGEGRWAASGVDTAELLLSANPGEEPRPLARIASGGELSRVTLALKTLASIDAPGKTLIFDEIDAGIGGRTADVVGQRLRGLGERVQVLCITHLPQVAAHGHVHFCVSKTVRNGRTVTAMGPVAAEARVEELARMIGGADVTDRVRQSAREMLTRRSESEDKAKGESERAKAKGRRSG